MIKRNFNKINFHITDNCNYKCIYCFGKFNCEDLSLENAKLVIDNCNDYFISNNLYEKYINFAGGEPLTYKYLDELIDYCSSLGIKVSIITNGTLLTLERINKWKNKVYCIGISIDSFDDNVNIQIGRCRNKKVLSFEKLKTIANHIHKNNIKFKINTVVSKINYDKDFNKYYLELSPDRVKFLEIHIVKNKNENAKKFSITKNKFSKFCKKHKNASKDIVKEKNGDMENSYIMINPSGCLLINDKGEYKEICDCKKESLKEKINTINIDIKNIINVMLKVILMSNIEVLNLEIGMPSVSDAIKSLKNELIYYKNFNKKCVVIIHGYGSSGVGGIICKKVREYLYAQKTKNNLIKTVINGGNFDIFNPEALRIKNKYPDLSKYINQYNSGITIIELY